MIDHKHVKLKNDNKSHDSKFSFSVKDLKQLSEQIENAWECRGIVDFKKTQERSQIKFRRSIYVVKNIKKNQVMTKKNIKRIRPGLGLNPIYYEKILGKKVNKNIKFGTPLKLQDIL